MTEPAFRQSHRMVAVLPTLLTLGNGVCGFGAITFAAKLGPSDPSGHASMIASSLVFLAMLFDMLDGHAARLTRQTSELGAQLDSLCDAISFGVAPAFLMLQFVNKELPAESWLAFHPRLLWTIAALFVVCAVLRLARFNVETDEEDTHEEFRGLPSPAAAGTIVAFPFAMPTLMSWTARGSGTWVEPMLAGWVVPGVRTMLPLIALIVACLMVSRVRYPHVSVLLLRRERSRRHVLPFVFGLAIVFWIQEVAVPVGFLVFAFGLPIVGSFRKVMAGELYKPKKI